mgnify:CR=1 FL=1
MLGLLRKSEEYTQFTLGYSRDVLGRLDAITTIGTLGVSIEIRINRLLENIRMNFGLYKYIIVSLCSDLCSSITIYISALYLI